MSALENIESPSVAPDAPHAETAAAATVFDPGDFNAAFLKTYQAASIEELLARSAPLRWAVAYRKLGLKVFPIGEASKEPKKGWKWTTHHLKTMNELLGEFGRGTLNVGVMYGDK